MRRGRISFWASLHPCLTYGRAESTAVTCQAGPEFQETWDNQMWLILAAPSPCNLGGSLARRALLDPRAENVGQYCYVFHLSPEGPPQLRNFIARLATYVRTMYVCMYLTTIQHIPYLPTLPTYLTYSSTLPCRCRECMHRECPISRYAIGRKASSKARILSRAYCRE